MGRLSGVSSFLKSICVVDELFVIHLRPAVLNLFRLTDHLVNFVTVRGPPRKISIEPAK